MSPARNFETEMKSNGRNSTHSIEITGDPTNLKNIKGPETPEKEISLRKTIHIDESISIESDQLEDCTIEMVYAAKIVRSAGFIESSYCLNAIKQYLRKPIWNMDGNEE